MLIILAVIAFIFYLVGVSINKDNAGYLLSGYNTMSEERRANYDLEGYLKLHRRFFTLLAVSMIVLGLLCYWINDMYLGIIIGIYPLTGFLIFYWQSQRFNKNQKQFTDYLPLLILPAALIFVAVLFIQGFQDNNITVRDNIIQIQGMYGEEIPLHEVRDIRIVPKLPNTRLRLNGMGMGYIKKGTFKTSTGETIKLFISTNKTGTFLEITKTNGLKIFYAGKQHSVTETHDMLRHALTLKK